MVRAAAMAGELDPRLKVGLTLVLGPLFWAASPWPLSACLLALSWFVVGLVAARPMEGRMIRSLFFFLLFWVVMKGALDAFFGLPLAQVVLSALLLGLRLAALISLGLCLALSTSSRSLGLALSWALRPFLGRERAWQVALSLALMVHFLPLCLSSLAQIKETLGLRWPGCPLWRRMQLIPQAFLRVLGQKTWNQTLAVAGRGLDSHEAWVPDFTWSGLDTLVALCGCAVVAILFAV
ncbi:energy-coupling factor transporter transmembrane protein EcfT [Pseudodesulfovibrio cashew]|nr:energy-coupling factor transporter transmembrane protein EcfT [Pseudodesulfovibrio cashew]